MGTHPIFESDFDCLTGSRSNRSLGMSRLSGLYGVSRSRLVLSKRKVTDSAGAYLEPPHVNKYAFPMFIMYNIPFMILGSLISKYGAEFLEEYELFVPDDDDDDD